MKKRRSGISIMAKLIGLIKPLWVVMLLAIIRHKIFAKLHTLAPAKLEGKNKGNLISVII